MITEYLINFATNLISILGYPGIALLTAIESMMVPIPPEITVVFSGFLAWSGKFNLLLVIVFAVLGSVIGSSAAYWIGYHFKERIAKKLIQKHGHFLFFTEGELLKVQQMFKKHGFWVITVSRFIPGLRSIISLPMGILQVPYPKFILYTLIGSILSATTHAYAGYLLGNNWESVRLYLRRFDIFILSFGVLIIVAYFYKRYNKKHHAQKI